MGETVVLVQGGKLAGDGGAVLGRARDEVPDRRGFDGLADVDAVDGEGQVGLAAAGGLEHGFGLRDGGVEVRELGLPVPALVVEEMGELDEFRIAGAVVEPENAEDVILPAKFAPVAQGARGQGGELEMEVTGHEREDAGVTGGFVVLGEYLEHDHAGPPIDGGFDGTGGARLGSGQGTELAAVGAIRLLVGEGPLDEPLRLGFERGVVELYGEGVKAVDIVRAALEGLAGAAEPSAGRADVGPDLVEVAGEAVGLNLELGAEPAGGADGSEWEKVEGIGGEWGAVGSRRDRSRCAGGEGCPGF